MKLMEKEKRQLDIKLDKLDRLCRALQQERSDLQATIKNLTKSSTNTSSATPIENGAASVVVEQDPPPPTTTTTDGDGSPNLYG
jgi:prefoldin subunit 5